MAIISPDSNGTSPASFRGFPELSVLIPAYNEEACIESVVREAVCVLHGMGRSFEVLVVDDGSSDGTPARLQGLCAEHAELRVLRLAENTGQSAALGAGFRAARGAIFVTLDADGQNDGFGLVGIVRSQQRKGVAGEYIGHFFLD